MLNKCRVIFSSGGNYRVDCAGEIHTTKPIGKFRNDNIKILVGDIVDVELNYAEGQQNINTITKLHERSNTFVRPNISNVDFAILITSVKEPKLNDIYLDKLITLFNSKNVEPIIIFTKIDLDPSGESNALIDEYSELGFKVFKSSMDNPVTLKELEPIIANSFVVITGQTGAGKSTLLNLLNPSLNLKTAEISKALGRGKHTTRHSEAHKFFGDTYIVDTPGFSSLEIELEPLVIAQNFLNFSKYIGKCRFNDCIHLDEAGCAMKLTPPSDRRIESYKHLLNGVK